MARSFIVGIAIVTYVALFSSNVQAFSLEFDSDDSCTSAVHESKVIEGSDIVVGAMRKGWWNCAEALAGTTEAENLHSIVALESRTITTRISSLRSAVEALRKPSQFITPAFQWAQSPDSIFLNVKFSHKLDAPATLDVIIDEVTLTDNALILKGSKDKKMFSLNLIFFDKIDTNQSSWTSASVGRIVFTMKKHGKEGKWPTLLQPGTPKPQQMHLWWDKQEEFRESLDKFDDDDDDEDDKKYKEKKKAKEEKSKKEKLTKSQEKKLKKKKKVEAKRAETKELEEKYRNLPEYVLSTIKSLEDKRDNEVKSLTDSYKNRKEEIENEFKVKKEEIEKEIENEKIKIEKEIEIEISNILHENNHESSIRWSDEIETILKSVGHQILTLETAGELLSKAATHIPKLEFISNGKGKVSLTHGLSDDHSIYSIWVVDEDTKAIIYFKHLAKDIPQVEFNIAAPVKKMTAFAYCNLHGVWSSGPLSVPLSDGTEEL